ncbi:MAG: ATP-binding protein [Solobacterium sp.]|nr:ATP-binding protein [Solobacterium sp.]
MKPVESCLGKDWVVYVAVILHEEFKVERNDYSNAGKISSRVKDFLKQIGVNPKTLRRIAVACYEAEINLVIHSDGGMVYMDVMDDGSIQLTFEDVGPGIPDLEKALTPGFSTASNEARNLGFGAGMGLPNIKRVSDGFDITSSPEGTTLKLSFTDRNE